MDYHYRKLTQRGIKQNIIITHNETQYEVEKRKNHALNEKKRISGADEKEM